MSLGEDLDDAIDRLCSLLSAEITGPLDYSETSLDSVEIWILGRYPGTVT